MLLKISKKQQLTTVRIKREGKNYSLISDFFKFLNDKMISNTPQTISRDPSTKYSIKKAATAQSQTSNTFYDSSNLDRQNPNNITKKKKKEIAKKLAESQFFRSNFNNSSSKLGSLTTMDTSYPNYNLLIKNPFKHHMRVASITPPPTASAREIKELSLLPHRVCFNKSCAPFYVRFF